MPWMRKFSIILVFLIFFFQIGEMDDIDQMRQAINWKNKIYVLMDSRKFGEIKFDSICSFDPIIGFVNPARTLFVN